MSKELLGIIAILLSLLSDIFYTRGIIQGKVKPHAFSWLIWAILTSIAFFAQLSDGGGAGAWVTGFIALWSYIFAIIGLGVSSRTFITKSDWLFFMAALLAIPIWYFTGDPLWSVIIITIIDPIAFVPTFRKAYSHPETENGATFFLSGTTYILSLLALQNFTLTTALYPATLVIANYTFVIMLICRKKTQKSHP